MKYFRFHLKFTTEVLKIFKKFKFRTNNTLKITSYHPWLSVSNLDHEIIAVYHILLFSKLFHYVPSQRSFFSGSKVTFLDQHQQHQYLLQQSALQIDFPLSQKQQFDTKSRRLDESQPSQGYIDESGNLCLLQLSEAVDGTAKQSISRHGTREKSRSSQKRRKKKKAKQPAKRELGK